MKASKHLNLYQLLILSVLVGGIVGNSFAKIPLIERRALIAFYKQLNGDRWYSNYGWKRPPLHIDGFARKGSECSWAGIKCNETKTNIVEIKLINNNLIGQIPQNLLDLLELSYLNLSENFVQESIFKIQKHGIFQAGIDAAK